MLCLDWSVDLGSEFALICRWRWDCLD